jgi:hypothetical protein
LTRRCAATGHHFDQRAASPTTPWCCWAWL